MNKLITFFVYFLSTTAAFAIGGGSGTPTNNVPEPALLPLLGIGILAIVFVQKFKQ